MCEYVVQTRGDAGNAEDVGAGTGGVRRKASSKGGHLRGVREEGREARRCGVIISQFKGLLPNLMRSPLSGPALGRSCLGSDIQILLQARELPPQPPGCGSRGPRTSPR